MGVAAAMTTPGSMALAFRLFDDEDLRVRALTVISTAGLVGLAVGPTVGGFVLAVAPWQVLLLADVPIAVLALRRHPVRCRPRRRRGAAARPRRRGRRAARHRRPWPGCS